MTIIKTCKIHGKLTIDKLAKGGKTRKGLQRFRCKVCYYKRWRLWRLKNNDKARETEKKSRFKNYEDKRRWSTIKKKFGIIKADYEIMLAKQNNVCAICKKPERMAQKKSRGITSHLSVDHCHLTKKIRGLLCRRCNAALGGFNDCINTLQSAIDYIKASTYRLHL